MPHSENTPESAPNGGTMQDDSSPDSRKSRVRCLIPLAAALFVVVTVALKWDAHTGFTSLLSFGGARWDQRLPVLRSMPLAKDQGSGYDGQFGAELAVVPDPRSGDVRTALDNPSYRSRRILLSWTAHVLGGGDPWRTLEIFALQNIAIWLGLAWLLAREMRLAANARAVAAWFCCMMTLGSLDSVRLALTDLPAVFLLAVGVTALNRKRPWAAVAAFALAGLTRETSLLGSAALYPTGGTGTRARLTGLARIALAALPLLIWTVWLSVAIPSQGMLGRGNFDWPCVAFVRHCWDCCVRLGHGDFDSRYLMGLVGALGLASQSIQLIARPRWSEPWWRIGVGFALLFWVLGDEVWRGYWAAARAVLPMTFAFNLLLPADDRFWSRLTFGNAGLVLHGMWRMLP